MEKRILYFLTILTIVFSCEDVSKNKDSSDLNPINLEEKINELNKVLIEAAVNKDFSKAISLYQDDAILLAEYNPLIDGIENIEKYYTEIFEKQDLVSYQKQTEELFEFEDTLLEIGKFKKLFNDDQTHEGKYINVWKQDEAGSIHLKTESFGYFHPIENAISLRVLSLEDESIGLTSRNGKNIPLELDAYDALNENFVRDRNTKKLLESYTDDAIYYPFANTEKSGKKILTEHYIDYHRNPVKIDSIQVWTYDFEVVEDGYIQYSKFYVKWTVPGYTGSTQGNGLNYYRRQEDNSLKIYRQIGLHIENE